MDMRSLNSLFVLFFCFLITCEVFGQSSVYYFEYDASGNRVKRYMVIEPIAEPEEDLLSEDTFDLPQAFVLESNVEENTDTTEFQFRKMNSDEQKGESALIETSVFPNPSNGIININGAINSKAIITSINGQIVKSFEITTNNFTLDVSANEPGQYLLNISWNSGEIKTWKITKL